MVYKAFSVTAAVSGPRPDLGVSVWDEQGLVSWEWVREHIAQALTSSLHIHCLALTLLSQWSYHYHHNKSCQHVNLENNCYKDPGTLPFALPL